MRCKSLGAQVVGARLCVPNHGLPKQLGRDVVEWVTQRGPEREDFLALDPAFRTCRGQHVRTTPVWRERFDDEIERVSPIANTMQVSDQSRLEISFKRQKQAA